MSASTLPASLAADVPLLPSRRTGLLMAAVMGISICQFLDATIANVALPHMRADLGASLDQISWALTSFIIAGVVAIPMTGWLADRIGSRNLFLGATLGFLLTSMLCGAAQNLTEIVVFRAMQGVCAAFIGPMSQTIMFDIARPSRQASAMTLWGSVVMIAPIAGPFLGGLLTDQLNWRWVFYINLPIGIPALAVLWWLLPSRPIVRRPLDLTGLALLALSLGALQLLLDRGQSEDWFESREIVITALFSVSAFWMFCIHTRFTDRPLITPELLRDPNFLVGILFMVTLGVANIALASSLPTMYQTVYGYSVVDTGLLLAPRGLGVMCTMVIVNRLMQRFDSRHLVALGYMIAAFSMWTMTRWSLDMDRTPIVISGFVQGLGLGLVFVPVNMMSFATLNPKYRAEGTSLLTLARNLGSSFGISAIVATLARNIQTSHADLVGELTPFSMPGIDPGQLAEKLGAPGAALLTALDGEVNRQALMIAYLDNFYMIVWVLAAAAPLSLIMRRRRPVTSSSG